MFYKGNLDNCSSQWCEELEVSFQRLSNTFTAFCIENSKRAECSHLRFNLLTNC